MRKTEGAEGWGIRVGGPYPYLAYDFYRTKKEAEENCTESYHRAVKVVITPLGAYKELGKEDVRGKETKKAKS